MNKLNRRNFLAAGVALGAVMAVPAWAMTTDAAERFVSGAITNLESIVNSGQSGAQLQGTLVGYFNQYADVPTVARAVIGAPWRGMSDSQKQQYVAAFQNYVTKKYAKQFDVLRGGKATITRSRDGGNAGVLVSVEFRKAGNPPRTLDLQVSDQSGKPKILDLKLEGVSMIGTEREQVRALLAKNGNNVDALIAQLNS